MKKYEFYFWLKEKRKRNQDFVYYLKKKNESE